MLKHAFIVAALAAAQLVACSGVGANDDSTESAGTTESDLSAIRLTEITNFSDADMEKLFGVANDQFGSDVWGEIGGVDALRVTGRGALTRGEGAAAVRAAAKKYYEAAGSVAATSLASLADVRNALGEAGVAFDPQYKPETDALLAAMRPVAAKSDVLAFNFSNDFQPRLALVQLGTRQILIFGGGYPDD